MYNVLVPDLDEREIVFYCRVLKSRYFSVEDSYLREQTGDGHWVEKFSAYVLAYKPHSDLKHSCYRLTAHFSFLCFFALEVFVDCFLK
jgi:hypothetical protein